MESSQIIILAIIATSLATFISRFMGALTSEKVSVKSKIFLFFDFLSSFLSVFDADKDLLILSGNNH